MIQKYFFEFELLLILFLLPFYFLLLKEDFFEQVSFDLFYKDLLFPGERGVDDTFLLPLEVVICLHYFYL
jgi:hypothetical protein